MNCDVKLAFVCEVTFELQIHTQKQNKKKREKKSSINFASKLHEILNLQIRWDSQLSVYAQTKKKDL